MDDEVVVKIMVAGVLLLVGIAIGPALLMITISHRYICDACGLAFDESYAYSYGERPAWPVTPPGWRELDGKIYCPLHEIKIVVIDVAVQRERPTRLIV